MNRTARRLLTTTATTVGAFSLLTGSALAHECYNPNKKPLAGAQIVFTGDSYTATKGLERRFEKGLVDANTGEGFHGIMGFVEDGFEGSTWQVTPTGSIPHKALERGPACQGMTSFDNYFANCLGG